MPDKMRCVRRADGEMVYYYPDTVKVKYDITFTYLSEDGKEMVSQLHLGDDRVPLADSEGVGEDWVRCRIADFVSRQLGRCQKFYRWDTPEENDAA